MMSFNDRYSLPNTRWEEQVYKNFFLNALEIGLKLLVHPSQKSTVSYLGTFDRAVPTPC